MFWFRDELLNSDIFSDFSLLAWPEVNQWCDGLFLFKFKFGDITTSIEWLLLLGIINWLLQCSEKFIRASYICGVYSITVWFHIWECCSFEDFLTAFNFLLDFRVLNVKRLVCFNSFNGNWCNFLLLFDINWGPSGVQINVCQTSIVICCLEDSLVNAWI